MASLFYSLALFFLIFNLVSSELVLEEGYTVTTVIDGHKLKINPYSVTPRPGTSDLVVLDSVSSLFYTVSFPLSEGSLIKRLSGDGVPGYADGEPGSARFNKPRSFAVDMKGNVYVADRGNFVIRKLSNSGVTTIAGGYSRKKGREDGPAQNASFSDDFELTFVPGICALLIADHGNQLVRQINLKEEDCARSSESTLGAVSVWVLGLGLPCLLLGLVIGTVVGPYIVRHEGPNLLRFNMTWKRYLINLVKQVQMLCFVVRNVIASSTLHVLLRRLLWLSLSHLSLMFRINNLESKTSNNDVSLLHSNDLSGGEIKKSPRFADQLKDLISFDGNLDLLSEDIFKQENDKQERSDVLSDSHEKLDDMIKANIIRFSEVTETSSEIGSLVRSSGLVRRLK